ncbi:MAG: NAD(P)-dependent oxidoreductase [Anaerolineae bacterium]|nr:NAD(P)-dependent oxidoreductase [Anaerolineae bacterium]
MSEAFLVTGALGCIGAWVVRNLVQTGVAVVAFDASHDTHRLAQILSADELARVQFEQGDITDFAAIEAIFTRHAITHVVHLAALLLPACKANPMLGERVNVGGTLHIFEAAVRHGVKRVVFASSIAVFDTADVPSDGIVTHDVPGRPSNLYGVYKQAMEGIARVYWHEHGVPSIGLRPATVFGAGRDNGITSAPTKAMQAAAKGQSYHIPYGGRGEFQYADDVAKAFIACARANFAGAEVFNLHGTVLTMQALIDIVQQVSIEFTPQSGIITFQEPGFPSPESFDASALTAVIGTLPFTPFEVAVRQTMQFAIKK